MEDTVPTEIAWWGSSCAGAFRKQSLQQMWDFKVLAEQGTDVRDTTD